MSMYNMINEVNPFTPILCGLIGIDYREVPRFRDISLEEKNGELVIRVFTRTGNGNRSDANDYLTDNPNYISDEDDHYDATYANWFFRIPEEEMKKLEPLQENPKFLGPLGRPDMQTATENFMKAMANEEVEHPFEPLTEEEVDQFEKAIQPLLEEFWPRPEEDSE